MRLAVIGAGMQAEAVCFDLAKQDDVEEILLVDINVTKAAAIASRIGGTKISPLGVNASCQYPFVDELKAFGPDAMLSTAPYHLNLFLMAAALEVPCHFCDLGGNNNVVADQKKYSHWAEKAGVSIIPATGLAPGMPGHLLADALADFDEVESFEIRVGGIPCEKGGLLNYSLVFSIEGLINEYVEPALVLKGGQPQEVESLTGVETLNFPPPIGELEAFVTSGALSTLTDTFAGRVQELNYKTIRWPGHVQFFQRLKALGMLSSEEVDINGGEVEPLRVRPRRVFETLAAPALDTKAPDMILLRATVHGRRDGKPAGRTYQMIEYGQDGLTAMMRTTAFPATIVLLMLARGQVTMKGFAPLEISIDPKIFLTELSYRGIELQVQDFCR